MPRHSIGLSTVRILALATAFLVVACAPETAAPNAPAPKPAVRPGTFAYDYRNEPIVSRFDGFATVVLSARGASLTTKVDSVHAWGGKVFALVQPTLAAWDRAPWEQTPWDAALWRGAHASGGVLRDAKGDTVWLFPGTRHDAAVVDFGVPGMADSVADAILELPVDGVVWDYGCGGVPVNGVAEDVAARWSASWARLLERVRAARPAWRLVCQCDQFTATAAPGRCDGLLLERVGHSLNPPEKVWAMLARDSVGRSFLRQEDESPSRRRLFAAIALITGASFAQGGDPNRAPSTALRDPEHWELDLGEPTLAWRELAPGVVERTFARGVVVANLGQRAFRYAAPEGRAITIPPRDALVARTRDASGLLPAWITTQDR